MTRNNCCILFWTEGTLVGISFIHPEYRIWTLLLIIKMPLSWKNGQFHLSQTSLIQPSIIFSHTEPFSLHFITISFFKYSLRNVFLLKNIMGFNLSTLAAQASTQVKNVFFVARSHDCNGFFASFINCLVGWAIKHVKGISFILKFGAFWFLFQQSNHLQINSFVFLSSDLQDSIRFSYYYIQIISFLPWIDVPIYFSLKFNIPMSAEIFLTWKKKLLLIQEGILLILLKSTSLTHFLAQSSAQLRLFLASFQTMLSPICINECISHSLQIHVLLLDFQWSWLFQRLRV